ncbi:MAG: Gfo/Idh/MocA family oxidoreductase [bacterium]|nr:Gfo/Idh/MocA family oxidoreductase [bacterium]
MGGDGKVRVGVYGAGRFANRTHIPNLQKVKGAEVVAVCDISATAVAETAQAFGIESSYTDAYQMLETEKLDVLYSVVPAFVRTDVEILAVGKGIHLFSEKPQSTQMSVVRAIDRAVEKAGVLSTVGFRERYRPLFQEARRLLADKDIVHTEFHRAVGSGFRRSNAGVTWHQDFEKHGGLAFDWGVHAMDYTRYMTGLNAVKAQAFYQMKEGHARSCAFNFQMDSGATTTMTFMDAQGTGGNHRPWFTFYFEGGYLETYGYERIVMNGDVVFLGEEFDPWLEQTRVFIEAVQSGDGSRVLNDYRDGLYSLGPILAGWESSRRQGDRMDVAAYMEA